MLNKFLSDERGNFAMMFAIASVPVLASIGMAIEYSNISTQRTKLQSAVDAAILFAGKTYSETNALPSNATINDFLSANYKGSLDNIDLKQNSTNLELIVDSKVPAFFFGKIYPDVFDQKVDATVPVGGKSNIEVAMVLDTTYSMNSDGKMQGLKVAATKFVEDLGGQANSETVIKMGIVPFSNHVNVGLSNRNASWINVPADTSEEKEICSTTYANDDSGRVCTTETGYADGVPYEYQSCSGGTATTTCSIQTVTETWVGCVGSRDMPYTFEDGRYTTRMPGLVGSGNWYCPSELTALTGNVPKLKTAISGLEARGDTYIAPGVMWGVRLLSNKAPFTEATKLGTLPANHKHKKIMILMTDGDNSKSNNVPHDEWNWGTNVSKANADTKTACKVARDAGVVIYSIAFGNTISDEGKAVMEKCAASPERYFSAGDADDLKKAFESIGSQIVKLRLSS